MTELAYELAATHNSTLQHCALIHQRLTKLTTTLLQAEAQLIHRLAMDYKAGRTSGDQVYAAYLDYRPMAPQGFSKRWDAGMPRELSYRRIAWTVARNLPDPDGNWRGSHPFVEGDRYPATGINVVYVLFDPANEPCYVGSTGDFPTRVKAHGNNGVKFNRYLAYRCADREAAYALEDRLLKQHKPYLNRKAGR